MSLVADSSAQQSPERQVINLLMLRCLFLALLLIAEFLFLTVRFDAGGLASRHGWLAQLLASASLLPQLAAVMATATLIFGSESLRAAFQQFTRAADSPVSHSPRLRLSPSSGLQDQVWSRLGISLAWLFAHLALFATFYPLTARVFEGQLTTLLAAAWLLVLIAIALTWCLALFPLAAWLGLLRQHWLPLIGCLALAVASIGIGQLAERMWLPLGQWTLSIVAALLGLVSNNIVADPASFKIGFGDFAVTIAPQCSGYEGIGLAWVFVATYLWWCRRELRWPQAWLLLPLATCLMFLFNSVRIAALVMIGAFGWRDIALGGFHSQAGWISYNLVMLGLVAWSRHSKFFSTSAPAPATAATTADSTAAYLLPLIALLGVLMVTGAFTGSFDWLYPLRVLIVGVVIVLFARTYAAFDWNWSWIAFANGVLVFVLWMALEPWPEPASSSATDNLGVELSRLSPAWAALWLAFRVVGSVVIAPFAEELAFRGYLMRRIQAPDFETVPLNRFSWPALIISSILFGALHPGRFVAGTLAGLCYGYAAYRRGNLVDAILAHATTNALIAAYVLATSSWSLW